MILPLEEQFGSREGGKTPAEENDQGRKLAVALREKKNYRTQVRSLSTLVSNWLADYWADSCLVDLTDVTLAFEDANSKLLDVVSVADVDAKEQFGRDYEADVWRDFETEYLSRFWSKSFVNLELKLNLGQDFEAELLSRFWGWI